MASCGVDALASWACSAAACFGVMPAGTAEGDGLAADTIAICAGVAPIDLASCSTCTSEEFSYSRTMN